jgi:hypothetical protein
VELHGLQPLDDLCRFGRPLALDKPHQLNVHLPHRLLGRRLVLGRAGLFARAARGADEEEDSLVLEEEDALELPESAAAD